MEDGDTGDEDAKEDAAAAATSKGGRTSLSSGFISVVVVFRDRVGGMEEGIRVGKDVMVVRGIYSSRKGGG